MSLNDTFFHMKESNVSYNGSMKIFCKKNIDSLSVGPQASTIRNRYNIF